MRLATVVFYGALFYLVPLFSSNEPMHQRLLLLETGNDHELVYAPVMQMLTAVGFIPTFKHAYETDPSQIGSFNSFLIFLDPGFFQATLRDLGQFKKIDNPYLHHLYDLLGAIRDQKNAFICFAVPAVNNPVGSVAIFQQLAAKFLAPSVALHYKPQIDQAILHFFKSDSSKSAAYATSLLPTRCPSSEDPFASLLPLCRSFHDHETNSTLCICSASSLLIGSACDPFCLTPFNPDRAAALKKLVFEHFQKATAEHFDRLTVSQPLDDSWRCSQTLTRYENYADPLICAWTGLDSFKNREADAVNALADAGVTHIWADLNPEWFLADAARMKEKKEQFCASIKRFTKAYACQMNSRHLPAFLVGTDLTSNFAERKPKNHAIDMYGFAYDHIPSPLDIDNFWRPEFFTVFNRFVDEWEKIGNGIPLAGVFFDFEMYHAQRQTGQYISSMDFSDTAWHLFAKSRENPALYDFKNTNERVAYLLKNRLCGTYFSTLENEAARIGTLIRQQIAQKIPNPIIGTYNIYLPYNWFYQGIHRGLSSPQNPIISATFCTEFLPHESAFKNRDIHLAHLPVILLSKITQRGDAAHFAAYCADHHGYWINRFSRLFESRNKKEWEYDWGLEVTPLSTQELIEELKTVRLNIQSEKNGL